MRLRYAAGQTTNVDTFRCLKAHPNSTSREKIRQQERVTVSRNFVLNCRTFERRICDDKLAPTINSRNLKGWGFGSFGWYFVFSAIQSGWGDAIDSPKWQFFYSKFWLELWCPNTAGRVQMSKAPFQVTCRHTNILLFCWNFRQLYCNTLVAMSTSGGWRARDWLFWCRKTST